MKSQGYDDICLCVIKILSYVCDYDYIKKYVKDNNITVLFNVPGSTFFEDLTGKYYYKAIMLQSISSVDEGFLLDCCKREFGKFFEHEKKFDILKFKIPHLDFSESILVGYFMAINSLIEIDHEYDLILDHLVENSKKFMTPIKTTNAGSDALIDELAIEYIDEVLGEVSNINTLRQIIDDYGYSANDDDTFEVITEKRKIVNTISEKIAFF